MAYTKLELQLVEALREALKELRETSSLESHWDPEKRDRTIISTERTLVEAEKWA